MTLQDAKSYMISNPGVKFTCRLFHNSEWITYDKNKNTFIFEDGYPPDFYWWKKAITWNCDWYIKQ